MKTPILLKAASRLAASPKADQVWIDAQLFSRLLTVAHKELADDDIEGLHRLVDRVLEVQAHKGAPLTMEDYDALMRGSDGEITA